MKKYPDRKNPLDGRVIVRQGAELWHLLQVDDSGNYHWLLVEEKSDASRKYYVGCAPHQTKISREIIDGERVFYPKPNSR